MVEQVNQREDAIKQARIDLRSEVEKSLMESASRFKQGRESTETALKAYHAACGKMSEGLKVRTHASFICYGKTADTHDR
jgi:hypothetical protein